MSKGYFSEEHNIFRASVRRFVEKEINPYIESWEEAEDIPTQLELCKKAADNGFIGLEFPEEYGGTPCDKFMLVAYIEEFIRTSGSTGAFACVASHTIACPPIKNFGTEEQKKRYLEPVLRGQQLAALGITEPNAGSDVANIKTRAVRDGDFYVVNGAKTFITNGSKASFITTAVRTGGPGAKGVSLMLIDASTPGFTVSKSIKKMGWHCSNTAELSFVDCRVPVDNIIGKEGEGFKVIMSNFQNERLELAVQATATAERALAESINYAKSREAFGQPISNFQVIRHKIVDMATLVEISREYNYRVAAKMEEGIDVATEVSMAKIFACQTCDKVCFDAVQIHGGYGFTREYIVDRLYRDSRILSIGGGTTEIMKEILSKRLI